MNFKPGQTIWFDQYDWADPDEWIVLQASNVQAKIERIDDDHKMQRTLRASELSRLSDTLAGALQCRIDRFTNDANELSRKREEIMQKIVETNRQIGGLE